MPRPEVIDVFAIACPLTTSCGIGGSRNLSGSPSFASQEKPVHRFPRHLWPKNKIPSVRPDGCCRKRDRSLIESPSSFCLLPCSKPGLDQDCNRSRPGSERRVPWRDPLHELGDLEAAHFAPMTLHRERTARAPLRPNHAHH